ncbi:hypothetical protein QQF64_002488 [Cirrhinus molitorella]|uniref:Uncharacterized protein n=1 Tax=Cirrhinus molitorella TaxID=172907 RepID=A0ABR3MQB9_9TELE
MTHRADVMTADSHYQDYNPISLPSFCIPSPAAVPEGVSPNSPAQTERLFLSSFGLTGRGRMLKASLVEEGCSEIWRTEMRLGVLALLSSTCYVEMGFRCPLWCIECVMGRFGSCQQGIAHNSSQWEMDIRYSWAVTSRAGAQKMGETEEN